MRMRAQGESVERVDSVTVLFFPAAVCGSWAAAGRLKTLLLEDTTCTCTSYCCRTFLLGRNIHRLQEQRCRATLLVAESSRWSGQACLRCGSSTSSRKHHFAIATSASSASTGTRASAAAAYGMRQRASRACPSSRHSIMGMGSRSHRGSDGGHSFRCCC